MQFLQEILQQKKKVFNINEVKRQGFPLNFDEFAVKNAWKEVKGNKLMRSYLPVVDIETGYFRDRIFFWGIALTVLPEWSNAYIKEANTVRERFGSIDRPHTITISDEWAQKLMKLDMATKGKILISIQICLIHMLYLQLENNLSICPIIH